MFNTFNARGLTSRGFKSVDKRKPRQLSVQLKKGTKIMHKNTFVDFSALLFVAALLLMPVISTVGVGLPNSLDVHYEPIGNVADGVMLPDALSGARDVNSDEARGDAANAMLASAAVFSQSADPASGVNFNYRIGASTVVGFGPSVVYYVMSNTSTLRLEFPGSNAISPRGVEPLASKTSYFYGNDPAVWRSGLVDFGGVVYEGIYPGIDLHYKTVDGALKYEFVVHPGADPSNILLDFTNADRLSVQPFQLCIELDGQMMRDTGLLAYQSIFSGNHVVSCAFSQVSVRLAMFSIGTYDPTEDLVIDPLNILSYSTYFGSSLYDAGRDIFVENGASFITGETYGIIPTTPGVMNATPSSGINAFAMKLSVDGSTLLYSTFLGGSGDDYGSRIVVDRGNAYVTGYTNSNPFPTTPGAYDRTYNASFDAFIVKISVDGSQLLYGTYLGGALIDITSGLAVENGSLYVARLHQFQSIPNNARFE
jgi:hypothetical protein